MLGFVNGSRDVQRHVLPGQVSKYRIGTPSSTSGFADVNIISEPGLYRLIMRSNVSAAEKFQAWVTAEVLPTIRFGEPWRLPRRWAPLIGDRCLLSDLHHKRNG
ncbi:hypothetical protein BH09ACT8_BH09ACT8_27120 [soil metagenome]